MYEVNHSQPRLMLRKSVGFVCSLSHPPAHVSSPSSRRDGSGGELGTATLSCFPYFVSFIYEFSSGSCEMSVFELKNN